MTVTYIDCYQKLTDITLRCNPAFKRENGVLGGRQDSNTGCGYFIVKLDIRDEMSDLVQKREDRVQKREDSLSCFSTGPASHDTDRILQYAAQQCDKWAGQTIVAVTIHLTTTTSCAP